MNEEFNLTPSNTAKATQRIALLNYMKSNGGQVSTIEAREKLGIAHPAGRFCEVRRSGLQIETSRVLVHDVSGRPHICALYTLRDSV